MPGIVSIIVVPAQPTDVFEYGPERLQLVQTFDRASYAAAQIAAGLATADADAPTYDTTKKTKSWLVTGGLTPDGNGNVTFGSYDPVSGAWVPFTMPLAEAMAINLYGIHSYPAYVIPPSPGTSVSTLYLSLQADAVALALSFGLTAGAVVDGSMGPPFPTVYASGEQRRIWNVEWHSIGVNAGQLIAEMNTNGVGAPGKWDLSGGEPTWISSLPSSLPPANPAWLVPCRPLLPNEKVMPESLSWAIFNTDTMPQQPAGGSGGLTIAQDATLSRIDTNLQKLMVAERVN